MTHLPRTTVVISPRERFSPVIGALKSLFATIPDETPVVVVEGASPDNIVSDLKQLQKTRHFELISRPFMVTPNEARNIGARSANTEFIVFADNDIEFSPGWLEALEENADRNQSDMVAPLTFIGPPSESVIHHAGGELNAKTVNSDIYVSETHRLSNHDLASANDINYDLMAPIENEICEFHCMMIRRDLLERIGQLDERLITREHMDLALRAKCLASKITFEKNSRVTYLALNKFNRSDLTYFLFRWSDKLALQSISAFESNWGVKINKRSLMNGSIGRRKIRAVASCYPILHKILGKKLFKKVIINPLEYLAVERRNKAKSRPGDKENSPLSNNSVIQATITELAARYK